MIFPPYLRATELSPGMWERPDIPFVLSASDVRVIDGDTLSVLAAPARGERKREEAFRIRFFSIDTPEKPKVLGPDRVMEEIGIELYPGNQAAVASATLRNMVKDRALLVEPVVDPKTGLARDRFYRLLAHVSVSGARGDLFVPEGAFCAERRLYDTGLGRLMPKRELPPQVSSLTHQLRQALDDADPDGLSF
ncbi:hypothetical protein LAZ40_11485 [Cereibacter sphaeroides]|uniref:thermonuclease family protein n=1 Tax=Cereibacter sphaeroides TaxID=1063 RepID=UPI001F3936F4|nr:hypothetical protein [Cereibacter sphaeroides]MCE6959640.1 hypothetical protein [Cereibacter sphaeroides]MCE6974499.1 hypothetical protein [Cereibacter sphaeroides]